MSQSYEQLIERFVKWAETCPDIRGAIIVGSRARIDHPADEWADLDIMVITTNPEYYWSTTDWVANMGKPLLTFVEPTPGDDMERRVLFEGMLDVDFAIIPDKKVQPLLQGEISPQLAAELRDVFGRGMHVLLDKDGKLVQFRALISSIEKSSSHPPTYPEFLETINDFLYHAVWTVKKLQRGELWTAKTCSDDYMKRLLLQMMIWHSHAIKGWNYDTWFRGRYLEEWVDRRALEQLRNAFAHYDKNDIIRALLATMDMFQWIAMETGEKLGYPYPTEADESITGWIRYCFSKKSDSK
ncbi:MAG: aminoglycoside 6-adenylyltransferase [Candidatus Hodarchaeota archaeon]